MSEAPSSSGIGRFTTLVLGLVVFTCVAMIGGAGFLKYQLDRAETTLAAPDNAISGDQDLFGRLRQEWGFGGFLGLAQKYIITRDPADLTEMKDRVRSADEIVAKLPETIPPQTRHELFSIAASFDDALNRISMPTSEGITVTELEPLYAALTVLDTHLSSANAEARLSAQNNAQFWAMLLTLVSWFSLIVAAACAAGIYLVLRDKHSAPMRALAQSIQNMARGDMRTAIWGIERQDVIGELARAMDIARYHFSHLPDVSLLSDDGPVRLRFEGETRSLFEAMMKSVSGDSENIREQSLALTSAARQNQDSMSALTAKVEMIVRDITERGQNGNQQIAQAVNDMVMGAENLKNAHAHAADQLTRLIPVLQDRAQGLVEITQITGKQLTHTLQSLASSEITLKANAEQSKETLSKLTNTADDLGERLFGAINLLQASGKIMAEATENMKSKWSDPASSPWNERLDQMKQQLTELQAKLNAQTDAQFGMAKAMEQSVQQNGVDMGEVREAILAPLSGQIDKIMGELSTLQAKMSEQASTIAAQAQAAPSGLTEDLAAINTKISELADLDGKVAVFISALPGDLRQALHEEVETLSEKADLTALQEKITALQASASSSPDVSRALEEVAKLLAHRIDDQRALIDGKQNELASKIDGLEASMAATRQAAEAAKAEAAKPLPPATLPPEIQQKLVDQWFQISAQIEASRASLSEALDGQIREMEGRLAAQQRPVLATKSTSDYALQIQIEKQAEILTELVATLGLLDAHVQQIKDEAKAG